MFKSKVVIHEVAIDGLPAESLEHVFVFYGYGTAEVPFSAKYQKFNARDYYDYETARDHGDIFDAVTHWANLDEITRQIKAADES